MELLVGGAIAALFLVPALWRPRLGRALLGLMFIGGGLFNLLYTLPNAPDSLLALVATAPIPPYREVVDAVVARGAAPVLAVLVAGFEVTAGLLILWRGPLARLAMLAAGAWGLGMLPVIPPYGLPIGLALTGAPGVAGLLLARHREAPALLGPVSLASVAGFAAVWAIFVVGLHPWLMNWGATPEERAMVLPGDTAPPQTYFTRGITIDAPDSAVWPWLLAIGQDRAGFLSNDYLENLTGADIHNADALRPEWQQRALGDRVPMGSAWQRAAGGDATLTTIHLLEPERAIADTPGRFVLLPRGDGTTRLLLRESLDDPIRAGAAWIIWDPMHFVMEQRMLQGIKERAEARPLVPPVPQAAAHFGWAIAGLGLLGLFVSRRGWQRLWLALPLAIALPPLVLTGDWNAALAAFLAVGITVAGGLVFGRHWWAHYLLLASGVALVLLLAPDSFVAFGLIFVVLEAIGAWTLRYRRALPSGIALSGSRDVRWPTLSRFGAIRVRLTRVVPSGLYTGGPRRRSVHN